MRLLLPAFLFVTTAAYAQTPLSYPPTEKGPVVEDYHGTRVADPYRWMEDLDSPEVQRWVAAQNRVTEGYLQTQPLREHFRTRITELWDYPKTGIPERQGGRLFYTRNSGLQRQAPLYMRSSLTAPPTLLLDPNVLSPDGSQALSQWSPSPDGRLLAYALSEGGADWRTVRVRDIANGRDLPGEVRWMRFSGIAWTKDARGFFYSRFPEPPAGKALEAALSGHTIYYHRVGTPQQEDILVYERKDLPSWFLQAMVTEDGRYLLIGMFKGSGNENRLYYADLGDPARPHVTARIQPLFEDDDAEFLPIGNDSSLLYLRTDRGAPNRRVIAMDVTRPEPTAWKTVVPERPEVIETAALVGGHIVAQYLVDVRSRVLLYATDGSARGEVPLPGIGTVAAVAGRQDSPQLFYTFTSPLYPTTVFAYDIGSRRNVTFEAPQAPVDVSRFETKQFFATSKDGTRVPFFLTARKDLRLDGNNPTMLYGYGGFSSSTLPVYRADAPAWLELGGVWVTANMRGGAEYGEAWHRAGMLDKKQNVFDDFIAVAEQLIKDRYTSPAKLGIMGGSNGGLLVGAVMEQRPELFAVALPAVGVMDMLRYDRFTGGRAWVPEYGSSSNAQQFPFLLRYSPLHNLRAGTCYPATLVTTADHDDRVVPSHSYKFTAALQEAQGCAKPVLIRVEQQGSHGYRPTDKQIAERADLWAFTAEQMGVSAQKRTSARTVAAAQPPQ
jgi:prolyl oligopeptidase